MTFVGIRIVCCPLCGAPLYRATNIAGPIQTVYRPRQGFDFSWKHALRGLGGYTEATRFKADVCNNCGEILGTLFEPVIRHIKDREVGR